MYLTEQEQQQINELVVEVEAASGAQLVVAVIDKADAYPEIPWKAFALGAALAALIVTALLILYPDRAVLSSSVFALTLVLGAGMACALTSVFAPAAGRLFLDGTRAAVEVRQSAQAMFLARSLFATRARVGVLLLVSLYERRAAIIADSGILRHITEVELEDIAGSLAPSLARHDVPGAARAGLKAIEQRLSGKLDRAGATDEIAGAIVQERGA